MSAYALFVCGFALIWVFCIQLCLYTSLSINELSVQKVVDMMVCWSKSFLYESVYRHFVFYLFLTNFWVLVSRKLKISIYILTGLVLMSIYILKGLVRMFWLWRNPTWIDGDDLQHASLGERFHEWNSLSHS